MSYWRKREREHRKNIIWTEQQKLQRLEQINRNSMQEIQRQINAFIFSYADKEGISEEEVRKRISTLDMEEYGRKARRYVADKDFSPRANREMLLYNLTMKTNRLELLKMHIWLELVAAGNEMEKFMRHELIAGARAELERQAGIMGMTVGGLDIKTRAIIDQSFLSAKWSTRLWGNQEALRREIDSLLQKAIVQGIHSRDLAPQLSDRFGVSNYAAKRLLITEKARVETEIQKISYQEFGFEEYEFVAEWSACPICEKLDKKRFKVGNMQAGENAAPMHPFCRCSTSPYFSREEYEADLERRGL
ncbi:minor capsid protein [Shouchella lonarensis]|uniref:Phage putative head morphogenesis protein, SPP1 gp7 family n=1 Tax=Shouchella lonarensis TaxID=1464122 RepID=A0A1G6HRQ0_9BACI|nr:minor capsid protein [Shouchella lonarensis]SDB96545.1 phage putative head morphogenesis protein, SPP1 gp7 family [Shouchella lonarensis]